MAPEPPVVIGSEPDVQWFPLVTAVPFVLGSLLTAVLVVPQFFAMVVFFVVAPVAQVPYYRRVARSRLVVSDEGLAVTGHTARSLPWHELRQVEFVRRKRRGDFGPTVRWILPTVRVATAAGWGSGHLVTLGILSPVGEAAASATLERAAARHGVSFVAR